MGGKRERPRTKQTETRGVMDKDNHGLSIQLLYLRFVNFIIIIMMGVHFITFYLLHICIIIISTILE